jgi:hypothetical protein
MTADHALHIIAAVGLGWFAVLFLFCWAAWRGATR